MTLAGNACQVPEIQGRLNRFLSQLDLTNREVLECQKSVFRDARKQGKQASSGIPISSSREVYQLEGLHCHCCLAASLFGSRRPQYSSA
jgi:hypothetical protein